MEKLALRDCSSLLKLSFEVAWSSVVNLIFLIHIRETIVKGYPEICSEVLSVCSDTSLFSIFIIGEIFEYGCCKAVDQRCVNEHQIHQVKMLEVMVWDLVDQIRGAYFLHRTVLRFRAWGILRAQVLFLKFQIPAVAWCSFFHLIYQLCPLGELRLSHCHLCFPDETVRNACYREPPLKITNEITIFQTPQSQARQGFKKASRSQETHWTVQWHHTGNHSIQEQGLSMSLFVFNTCTLPFGALLLH